MTRQTEEASPTTIIPTGDVVVLREDELDTDLTTAIGRIRSDEATARSRILIVRSEERAAAAEADEVGDAPIPAMPVSAAQFGRMRERAAIEAIGERLETIVDCMAMFADEAEATIHQLDEDATEAPRARIQSQVRRCSELLGWSRETLKELRVESRRAAAGLRFVEVGELVVEAARNVEALFSDVRVEVERPGAIPAIPARSAELAEALFLAVGLVVQRIGRVGTVQVSHELGEGELQLRVVGYGEPKQVAAGASIARFRTIVEAHGGRIMPSELGAAGTGLILALPMA